MTKLRWPALLVILLLGAALVAACSDDDDDDDDGGAEATATATEAMEDGDDGDEGDGGDAASVAVALSEWAITPSPESAAAGDVSFEVTNDGTVAHNLYIVKSDEAVDALPTEGGLVDAAQVEMVANSEDVAAGESATVSPQTSRLAATF